MILLVFLALSLALRMSPEKVGQRIKYSMVVECISFGKELISHTIVSTLTTGANDVAKLSHKVGYACLACASLGGLINEDVGKFERFRLIRKKGCRVYHDVFDLKNGEFKRRGEQTVHRLHNECKVCDTLLEGNFEKEEINVVPSDNFISGVYVGQCPFNYIFDIINGNVENQFQKPVFRGWKSYFDSGDSGDINKKGTTVNIYQILVPCFNIKKQ